MLEAFKERKVLPFANEAFPSPLDLTLGQIFEFDLFLHVKVERKHGLVSGKVSFV